MPWFQHSLWFDIGHNPDSACQPRRLISPVTQRCPQTHMHIHTLFSSVRGQPSLIPRRLSIQLCLPSQAWAKGLKTRDACFLWPLCHPFILKRSSLSHPVTIFIAHSCVLPPSLLPTCSAPYSLETLMRPPVTPCPPSHCSAGIKEIGGVELLSWIRHGQCSLDWTKPPWGQEWERLNRMGIWWQYASMEGLSAFITML